MICPNCKKDYKDVPEGIVPGHFYRSDDHYYKDFRRFGVQCTNCGFIAEMITRATGDPYRKKELNSTRDQETIDMFDDDEKIELHQRSVVLKDKVKKLSIRK